MMKLMVNMGNSSSVKNALHNADTVRLITLNSGAIAEDLMAKRDDKRSADLIEELKLLCGYMQEVRNDNPINSEIDQNIQIALIFNSKTDQEQNLQDSSYKVIYTDSKAIADELNAFIAKNTKTDNDFCSCP